MAGIEPLQPPTLAAIEAAASRIEGFAIRTPLIRFEVDAPGEIWLKLENLQPIGSFKIRGAASAIGKIPATELKRGVLTASAGNMAQGVAWCARRLEIPCDVVVPDSAPQSKLEAIARLGGNVHPVPFERWWQTLVERGFPGLNGRFVHPVSDPDVIAGNGTIGLEIADELPDVDTVVVPFGGGGLSCGIAAALRERLPRARVLAAEVESAAPLAAALDAGQPVAVAHRATFVDGIGAARLLPEMWPLVRDLLAGSRVVSLDAIAEALRRLVERAHTVAEGAGAASVAAALAGQAGNGKVVCVVSGGNIDAAPLRSILDGRTPD